MKLMDEVKLESSVEALEALCDAFKDDVRWPEIRQNLHALREMLNAVQCTRPEGCVCEPGRIRDDYCSFRPGSVTSKTQARQPSEHYPVEWGPSDARRLTCACGNPDPAHYVVAFLLRSLFIVEGE